jgi:O-antigen/teichoic acid export membrane protein
VSAPDPGTIGERTTRGVGWTVFWRLATRGLGLVSTLILARLLVPADFGLVALATTLSVAVDALATTGVHDVLIRHPGYERRWYDTAFTLTLIRGAATAAVLLLAATPAAAFFDEPRLALILVALAVCALIESTENVGTVDFRKHLRFDLEFIQFIVPRILAIATTVTAAFLLRSYWALVIGLLAQRTGRVALGYILHPYRPRLSLAAWREMLSFSIWLWAIAVAGFLRERTDALIVGRMLDPFKLGLFMLSAEIAALPTTELVGPLCRVLFSSFAAARNLNADLPATFLRALGIAAAIIMPTGVGVALVSSPLVALLLGPKWMDAVELVAIVAPFGALAAIGSISSTVLVVSGHPNAAFWASLAMALLRIVLLVGGIHLYGLLGAAWATACCLPVECVVFTGLALRFLGIPVADLLFQTWRSVAAAAIMVAGIMALGLHDHDLMAAAGLSMPIVQLILTSATGAAIYAASHLALWVLSNRPDGAERFLLMQLHRLSRRRLGWVFAR